MLHHDNIFILIQISHAKSFDLAAMLFLPDANTVLMGIQMDIRVSGLLGLERHARQQKRAPGDCFEARIGIGQADEQRPPVVDQRETGEPHAAEGSQ